MNMPGSLQMGIGKSILMKYPWWRLAPHPEWVDPRGTAFQQPHSEWFDVNKRWDDEKGDYLQPYASGIPNEIRFIYIPPRTYDAWGPLVTNLEENVTYHASYYDPMNGEQYKLGKVARACILRYCFKTHSNRRNKQTGQTREIQPPSNNQGW